METNTQRKWMPTIPEESRPKYLNIQNQVCEGVITKYNLLIKNKLPMSGLSPGVMGGTSGELLYLFYAASYHDDESIYDLAFHSLEALTARIDERSDLAFCNGLSGFIWSLYHLENKDIVPDAGLLIDDEILDTLYSYWLANLGAGNFDYMHGGLSIAMPLIESKRKTDKHISYLENIVSVLDKSALREGQTARWLYIIDPKRIEEKGTSLGLSHGMPSVVAILSKICQQGIAVEKSKRLIEEILNYILSKKSLAMPNYMYPAIVSQDQPPEPNPGMGRIAWCYGDINIAIALLYGYKVIKNERYWQEAQAILTLMINYLEFNKQFTHDGSFCHGTFGNGHLFNRLYNYTGNPTYKMAAKLWYDLSLEKVSYENNVFRVFNVVDRQPVWSENKGVLSGISGVGLSILSAVSDIAPDWDDMFLLNI